MTRSLFILFLFTIILNDSFGQIAITEKEILESIVNNSRICDKIYLTDKTETHFINQFQKSIKQKDNWISDNGKSRKISFTKIDKAKILNELEAHKKIKWTDSTIFSNNRIVPFDSIFKVDYYIDKICLEKLMTEKKNAKVLSICKPIFFDNENSFVIYTIEIGILLKHKCFYYASYALTLYRKTKNNKWIKVGDLISGIACNG